MSLFPDQALTVIFLPVTVSQADPGDIAVMNELFEDFAKAHATQNGYLLAQSLSPVAPLNQPHRLRSVWQSTNPHSVKGDIKHFIKTSTSHRRALDNDEVTGWIEVYAAYWKAVGEIIAGESGKVSFRKRQVIKSESYAKAVNMDQSV